MRTGSKAIKAIFITVAITLMSLPIAAETSPAKSSKNSPKPAATKPAHKPADKPVSATAAKKKTTVSKPAPKAKTHVTQKAPPRVTAPTLSAQQIEKLRQSLTAAENGRWDEAYRLAAQAPEPFRDIIAWMEINNGSNSRSFSEIIAYASAHSDWPSKERLTRAAEQSLQPYDENMRAWFEVNPPITAHGALRWIEMLQNNGQSDAARAIASEAWVNRAFSDDDEKEFLAKFSGLLTPKDHAGRLDRLAWEGEAAGIQRMRGLADPTAIKTAEIRLKFQSNDPDANSAFNQLDANVQADPGLTYERVRWLRRKNAYAEAETLLLSFTGNMQKPEAWWVERIILARRALEENRAETAYALVAPHGLKSGTEFADAEFFAGWVALRRLNKPQDALRHFSALSKGVSTPISLARGNFWQGRAYEAMGQKAEALNYYEIAAKNPTTFYGQLATQRLGKPLQINAAASLEPVTQSGFSDRSVVKATALLLEIGADKQSSVFFAHLLRTFDKPEESAALAKLAAYLSRPDLAIRAAKLAERGGYILFTESYPTVGTKPIAADADPALVHALIRQESAFDIDVVSRAGALGLMQLMPATAKLVAKDHKLPFDLSRLTRDGDYNVSLGSAHISDLVNEYGGSYIMATAAYNAGSHRVKRWVQTFGDPRLPGTDPIDWIESITFSETRNYVQRVLETLSFYRTRLAVNGAQQQIAIGYDLTRGGNSDARPLPDDTPEIANVPSGASPSIAE